MFLIVYVLLFSRVYFIAGLPQGQESQEKLLKNVKIQEKMRVFGKKSGNLTKFLKTSDFVCLNLQNSLFSKAFKR